MDLRTEEGLLVGVCPFHEAEGLLVIDPSSNTWACSTCSVTEGSVIDWVMTAEGVSRRHAEQLVRSGYTGVASDQPRRGRQDGPVPRRSTTAKLDSPFESDGADSVLLDQVVAFYTHTLKDSADALTYLQGRGVRDPQAIDTFRLGFANRSLAYRLPARNRRAGADLRGRLQDLGVLRPSGHEHLSGSVVVPLFDEDGSVTNIYGRKITRNLRPGTDLHCWLDSTRRGLFNRPAFSASSTIIVTASLIDALVVWSSGLRHVTALHGLDGPTDELVAALREHGTNKVILVFRRDQAGDVERVSELLAELGIEVLRGLLPAGMDVSDYATSVNNPQEAITQVIRSAEWISGTPTTTTSTPVMGIIEKAADLPEGPHREAGHADEVVLTFEDRRWRVRGLDRTSPQIQTMKVNVMLSVRSTFHVDVVELYAARQRATFVRMASEETGLTEEIIKADLGRVLLKLEEIQDQRGTDDEPEKETVQMSAAERAAALGLLGDPQLVEHILEDFEKVGVVGERNNLLVGYLATISRKLSQPLAVVIQSSSAAGKSSLMEAILSFIPEEDRLSYSAMTAQAVYYMGATDLRHRVLSFAEEEGVGQAAYPLKLLQSEGSLRIASTGKDPNTGRLVSHEYRVEGPVAIMMTTTRIEIDEELLSRCLVLSVDETPEQTRSIQRHQRWELSLEGQTVRQWREVIHRLHQHTPNACSAPSRWSSRQTSSWATPTTGCVLAATTGSCSGSSRPSSCFISTSGS